jgi:hypothetical protein
MLKSKLQTISVSGSDQITTNHLEELSSQQSNTIFFYCSFVHSFEENVIINSWSNKEKKNRDIDQYDTMKFDLVFFISILKT